MPIQYTSKPPALALEDWRKNTSLASFLKNRTWTRTPGFTKAAPKPVKKTPKKVYPWISRPQKGRQG